jgi:2,3-bisphosphoglycerate-dependent phosphoglycerate mutase
MTTTRHLLGLATLVFTLAAPLDWIHAAEQATFFVVRHAEKEPGDGDVSLSSRGTARAQSLREIIKRLGNIQAVYVTNTKRTRETAQPSTPSSVQSTTYDFSREYIQSLIQANAGKNVLIVGHSNTAHKIAAALAGLNETDVEPVGESFDTLFIVTSSPSAHALVRLHYGNEVP